MRNLLLTLAAVASLFCFAASAAEWFVSPTGSDSAAGTEVEPFRTITNAVARASANDTIILLPGDHVEGSATTTVNGNKSTSRVVIDKKLTIRSKNGRASRDTTRIVGAWDTDVIANTPYGFGPNAVRCVWIDTDGSGTKLEGITFVNGSVPAFTTSSHYTCGGGVIAYDNIAAKVIDCAFIDCQAFNGGGLYSASQSTNVEAVRCLFKRCRGSKFGHAMRGGSAYNCVFDDNHYTCFKDGTTKNDNKAYNAGTFSYGKYAINCTFVNGRSYGIGGDGNFTGVYNCLFQNNQNSAGFFLTYCPTVANNVKGGNLYDKPLVYSPFDNDYRLTSNSTAIDAGDATYLSTIPEEFRDTDYYGNPRTTGGNVSAGAVQETASASASGVSFNGYDGTTPLPGAWQLDGEAVPMCYRTWVAREGWPVPFHVRFVPNDGYALVRYSFGSAVVWPLRDDTAWITTSRAGQVQGVSQMTTSSILYADPVNGSDDTGDGSEANPYRTLNKAVNATTSTHVVFAKAGDYCTAEEDRAGCKNRVVVPDTFEGTLRVVAVEGPESTFITGASDSTSNGTGANAVRCIAVASTNANCAAFQGFTLRDGRTGVNDTTWSMGAALHNVDSTVNNFDTAFLLDCVVTNCSGNRAACVSGGNAYRCRFENCNSFNGSGQCVLRYCSIVSSSFTGCGGSSQVFGNTAKGYNCTIYGSSFDNVYISGSYKGYLYNCVMGGRSGTDVDIGSAVTDDQVANTLYQRLASGSSTTFTTAVQEAPLKILCGADGDYRLASDSAGLYLASASNMKSCMDIDGNPFVFDGTTYQAGCYALREGSTLYVDAVNGNDATGDGSVETPYATLAAVMAAADYGDTVIALPGTYDSGTMVPTLGQSCYTVAPTLPARVVVKGGVTLESRDGAEATIIKGTSAATDNGCGDGAVRGVFLCAYATLRGFTVTGGRTLQVSSASIDAMGGGVCGAYDSTVQSLGLVENCIISNNYARTGGGAQYGTFRNCRFYDNAVYNNMGFALCRGFAEGCIFKGNGVGGNHSTAYCCKVVNCTFFGGQAGASKADRGLVFNEGSSDAAKGLTILNSIILGNYQARAATNCYVLAGAANVLSVNVSGATPSESGIITGDASIIDEGGKPVADAAVIDAGDASFCSAALLAGRDVAGVRRVLNSSIDIGAYEYDWGVPWAKTLGRRITITDMPSNAALAGNRLMFADGTVSMTWEKGRSNAPYIYNVRVIGNGTLTVTVNGEAVGSYTSADGAQELRFISELEANALRFAYAPGAGDTGGAELFGFRHSNGLIISVY